VATAVPATATVVAQQATSHGQAAVK
jgi:hypothetical protein